ncbi:MAG: hypothetical protein OER90_15330, partial [Gemmatimonadota bacterium]|nr:hypothetical protein [Gemmatimonadota bacterium]
MFELRVLGAVGLRGPDGSQLNAVLSQAKALALLSYLALNAPRGTQRRDSLLALFWPDLDLPHARNALNQALHRLRRSLGESAITSHGSSDVGLSLEECWCDAVAFERSLEGGAYAEALELYRGALLPGVYVSGAPGFERWLEQERTRLQQRAFQAARQLADQRGHEEGPGAAVPWLRRACDFDPTDDRTVRSLMEALAGSGDVRGALQTYDEYVSRLAADVHLSPSAETAASAERLRSIGRAGVPPHRAHWPPRIAVLPFLDLSPATDHAHLSDGITGAIISQLGRIGGLEVISQTSTMSLKHSAKPLEQIATLLDVGAVVEGSVLPAMNRVRITVQLIEVRPERHLWTKEYERDLRDVLALEREVALDIARGVRVTIAAQSDRTLGTLRPVNEAALEAYLRGLALLNQFSTASIRASLDHFTTAIVTDPDYAPPYVGLADAYILLGHGDLPTNEAF